MYKKPEIMNVDKQYEKPNFLLSNEVEQPPACGCYGSY